MNDPPVSRTETVAMALVTGIASAIGAAIGNWVWKRLVGDDEAVRDERLKQQREPTNE
jgi:hypothetical protein